MDYKIIILAVVITIILVVDAQVWKQSILKKLLEHMQQGDFNAYFKPLDSLPCKYFCPPFSCEYMCLNGCIMKVDKKKIGECFELIPSMRMSKKQEPDVAIKAFCYYPDEGSKKKCKILLERMKKIVDESITQECQVIYGILLEERTSYIGDMEKQLKNEELREAQKGMFHYMLALQYSYLEDGKKKREHLQAASKDLKGTPYEMKINQLARKQEGSNYVSLSILCKSDRQGDFLNIEYRHFRNFFFVLRMERYITIEGHAEGHSLSRMNYNCKIHLKRGCKLYDSF